MHELKKRGLNIKSLTIEKKGSKKTFLGLWLFLFAATLFFSIKTNIQAKDSLNLGISVDKTPDSLKLQMHLDMAKKFQQTNKSKALYHAFEADEMVWNMDDPQLKILTQLTIGKIQFFAGDVKDALRFLGDAYALAKINPSDYLAEILYMIGKVHLETGNLDTALKYFLDALKVCPSSQKELLAFLYDDIGSVYLESGKEVKEAEKFFERSMKVRESMKDISGLSESLNRLGALRLHTSKDSFGLDFFRQAAKHAIESGNLHEKVQAYYNMGKAYESMGYLDKSEVNYKIALKESQRITENSEEAFIHLSLYKLYISTNNNKEGKFHLIKADSLTNQHPNDLLKASVLSCKAEFFENAGAFKTAIESYKELILLRDKINQKLTEERILDIKLQNEIENYQLEINELSKENDQIQSESESEKEKFRFFIALLIIILFISIGFILFVYQTSRFRSKINADLEQKNAKILQQNKALQEVNSKLELSEKELMLINNTKDRFFSIVAHDLKSPINTLKGSSHLISSYANKLSKEEIVKMIDDQSKTVKSLSNLLDNLLTWARAQMRSFAIEPQYIKVPQLFLEMVEIFEPIANNKQIDLLSKPGAHTIYADVNSVRTILRNLISNALKFTPKHGKVTIESFEASQSYIGIRIIDNGNGMDENTLLKLRDSGSKISTLGTEGEKGTGLGLMICYEFILLNNGQFEIQSELKKGSSFTVLLPKNPPSI